MLQKLPYKKKRRFNSNVGLERIRPVFVRHKSFERVNTRLQRQKNITSKFKPSIVANGKVPEFQESSESMIEMKVEKSDDSVIAELYHALNNSANEKKNSSKKTQNYSRERLRPNISRVCIKNPIFIQ